MNRCGCRPFPGHPTNFDSLEISGSRHLWALFDMNNIMYSGIDFHPNSLTINATGDLTSWQKR